jgi:glutamate racemase
VGVEPGVKPAIAHSRSKRIAVMATSATKRRSGQRSRIGSIAAAVAVLQAITMSVAPCETKNSTHRSQHGKTSDAGVENTDAILDTGRRVESNLRV